jgi:Ca2+-binding EF-hand superfamily protein
LSISCNCGSFQQVEISRQNLALNSEFDVQKAFNLIDVRSVGRIDAYDLVDFMRKHYITCELSDASDIIREYDSTNDAALNL